MGGSPSILVNVPGLEGTKKNFWAWRYSFSCGSKGHKSDWELPPNLGVSRVADSKSHIPSDNFPTVRSELSKDTHQTCPNKGLKASDGCQWRCDECWSSISLHRCRRRWIHSTAVASNRWGAPPAYLSMFQVLKEQRKIFEHGGTPSPAAPRDTSQTGSCLPTWESAGWRTLSHISQVIISQLCVRNSVRTLTRHVQTKAWRHQTAASGAVMNAEAPLHCTGAVGTESTRTAVANDRWGLRGAPPAYLLIPIRLPVCECGIEGGSPSILVNSDTTACGAVNAELRGAPPAYLLIPIRLPVALWMRNWEFKKRAQPAASPWGCQQIENLRDWRLLSTVLLYQDAYSVRNWAKLLPVWGSPLSAAGDSVMNPISNFPVLVRKSVKFFQEKGLPQNNCQEGGHPTRRPGTLGLSLSTVVWGWLANVSLSYVCLVLLLATMSSITPFGLAVVLAVLSSTAPFCLALLLCCWHCFYYQGKGDRDLKLQWAMVLLLSRHAGQSQGTAKLRREDLRMVRLPLRRTLPFLDTSPKVDLSPYFSKVGLDSSNSGIRQRFNVDRSGYPPVTYGGRVGVLFQNFCWGWVAEVPTLHTFLGWVAKVTTPHTLTWRMFSFWLGCEPWERQMFWNQNSSTMRYNKVKRDWLLLLDIFLMYADIERNTE